MAGTLLPLYGVLSLIARGVYDCKLTNALYQRRPDGSARFPSDRLVFGLSASHDDIGYDGSPYCWCHRRVNLH
jgi:hypothetical protein